jgi:putative N-acetyltransferase (TIGR04045 family)
MLVALLGLTERNQSATEPATAIAEARTAVTTDDRDATVGDATGASPPITTVAGPRVERSLVCRIAATVDELDAHYAIRQASFVRHQGLFDGSDIDDHDRDPRTMHLVAICEPTGEVAGAVRCYARQDGVWFGGRLVVSQAFRASKLKVAPALVRAAEEHVRSTGANTFLAYIQCRYAKLFEHIGWVRIGGEVEYAGTPHQLMRPGWSEEPEGIAETAAAGGPPPPELPEAG